MNNRSTGPKTPEGKKKSALNAMKHALTGQVVLLPGDNLEIYNTHVNKITADRGAVTYEEKLIAKNIADAYWRLERIKTIENGTFGIGHTYEIKIQGGHERVNDTISDAQIFLQEAKGFATLTLYEQRINRMRKQDEARLKEMIEERRAVEAQALEEAKALAMLAYMKGEDYNPQDDGFVFSSQEIRRIIDREQRLKEAAHYKKNAWDTQRAFEKPWPLRRKAA